MASPVRFFVRSSLRLRLPHDGRIGPRSRPNPACAFYIRSQHRWRSICGWSCCIIMLYFLLVSKFFLWLSLKRWACFRTGHSVFIRSATHPWRWSTCFRLMFAHNLLHHPLPSSVAPSVVLSAFAFRVIIRGIVCIRHPWRHPWLHPWHRLVLSSVAPLVTSSASVVSVFGVASMFRAVPTFVRACSSSASGIQWRCPDGLALWLRRL